MSLAKQKSLVWYVPPLALGCMTVALAASAWALEYLPHAELNRSLQKLASAHSRIARVDPLTKLAGKSEPLVLELGAGTPEQRRQQPAMLAVAGIEGNDLAGPMSLLVWAQTWTRDYQTNAQVRELLDHTTIYLVPRLNREAADRYFARPQLESAVNPRPVDEDHDGMVDEDGPNDLNGDGLITWMRVPDPEGEYILDPADPRLLLKADRSKGEAGAYRLLTEGWDDDKDEAWNEDGSGGVNLNRNFPYNYRFFAPDAGKHPVSEFLCRALADFIVDHPNIAVVFTFGAADNLVQTPKGEAPKRPPTAIHEDDIPFYRELGKTWRDSLGLKKELNGSSEPGTFSDWIYFHRGRLSLAARPWTPAMQLELAKASESKPEEKKEEKPAKPEGEAGKDKPAAAKDGNEKAGGKSDPDSRNADERAFLKWIEKNAPAAFVEWKTVEHPDFPGQRVEVGGFAPYAKTVPPASLLDELTRKHAQFLSTLAGKLPRIGIRKAKARHLGNSIYEITVQVENTGYLPTQLSQGGLTREVNPTRLELLVDSQDLLAGTKTTVWGPIAGSGGMKETRFTINGKDRRQVVVEVKSMLAGSARATLELTETR